MTDLEILRAYFGVILLFRSSALETSTNGCVPYGNHCYFVETNCTLEWALAAGKCQDMGGQLARVDDAGNQAFLQSLIAKTFNDSSVQLNITDEYRYQYLEDLNAYIRKYNHMLFNVRACNDAHVILSEQHSDVIKSYEIVIGGWGNTMSVIRTCKQCESRTSFAGSPLSCDSFKSFWISWENGTIRVGIGHIIGQGEFMKWTDPSSHKVNYVGVSTWHGSSTEWKILSDPHDGLFWLGGTDLYDGEWQWFPESEYFGYSNWLPGYPGNFRKHCTLISVHAGFKWITGACMESKNYVCEIDKQSQTVNSILG